MKKLALLWMFLVWWVILSWCNKTDVETPKETINTNQHEAYENNLIIWWVVSSTTLWWEFDEWSLSTRITYEDHSDVVVFPKWTWESYFENENDSLPGNTIAFKWEVESIDAAAGTHYYEVAAIDSLSLVSYPTKEEVEELLWRYVYCETDADCIDFYPWCPLGCSKPINKEYKDIATKIAENFRNHQENQCAYRCMPPVKIACENYKCTAITEENKQNNASEWNWLSSAERQEANSIFAN